MKICLVSLGCTKNLVDSELILGLFAQVNGEIVTKPEESDCIIINTCGFVEDAKKESIAMILEMLDYRTKKRPVIVSGCLAERYIEELKESLPEVDLIIPLKDYEKIGKVLADFFKDEKFSDKRLDFEKRVRSTYSHLAYLRISDGCDNKCSYCAIPLIRGNYKSRLKAEIISEAKLLIKQKVKEIVLISQDLTNYGNDLAEKENLTSLLQAITEIKGDFKVRLLYLYPDEITDCLLDFIKNETKMIPYFDIPIQHASDKILKLMNRRGSQKQLKSLFAKIKEIPNAVLRTTVMLGFPEETEEDFLILKTFIEEIKFNHLGSFLYSPEEGTASFLRPVPQKDASMGYLNSIMEKQSWISLNHLEKFIGKVEEVIVEGYDKTEKLYYGRNYYFAPDEIDGRIIFKSKKKLNISESFLVKITECDFYQLKGEIYED
ncbi:MAG: 30S ribosomal protein S12 methylthiotransferase RimO [Erysipelotrichales bacterium]|nr:30S ribosomal protein S12 methylthiotransferase RimO [Erysipelotrichales bacterium]